jgi:hypothetical protein
MKWKMAQEILQWWGKIEMNICVSLKLGHFLTKWQTVILPGTAFLAAYSFFLAVIQI